jgi:hypothetical protein
MTCAYQDKTNKALKCIGFKYTTMNTKILQKKTDYGGIICMSLQNKVIIYIGIQTPQDNFILHKTLIELNYMLMNRFMDFITFMRFQRKLHSHTLKIPVASVPGNQQ